jgi:glycosyltransferase involved in cell wall biosynthesis
MQCPDPDWRFIEIPPGWGYGGRIDPTAPNGSAMTHTDRPIRILRLIARLNVGGPALHVALLTARLHPPAFESRLACGNIGPDEGDMAYYAAQQGVTPHFIPELGRALHPIRDLVTLWKVYRLIRQFKPDVVHTHTAKAGFVGRLAAWLAGVPVIVHTYHGHVFHGYFSPARTRFFLLLERLTGRTSTAVLTLTDALRDELADTYRVAPRRKFRVIPLGLDLDAYARTPRKNGLFRAEWGIPADAPLVGIVGRLVPIKNHALFLQAMAAVREAVPDVRMVIIGDGETRAAVEAQVDTLGLRDAVIFTGWQQDLAPAYADMDALVISSDNEGTPTAVIQALAGGCPVVCTAVGGIPDLLDDGTLGTLVPPGDAPALADAIRATLEAPPDTADAQAAMLSRYSVDRLAADIADLYRELIKDRAR